jgi:CRP/FNR family cyclic AMP-dependent transcriptional regulator
MSALSTPHGEEKQGGDRRMMEVTAPVLAGQRFLHGMAADQLDALAATASEVTFPAGHRIFADGGYVDKFWLIESGHVALDVQLPGECPAVIGTVGIGKILGWSWLVPPYQWAFGAVCVTRVRAIEFNAPAVRDRCTADPALGYELTQRLFQVLAERLQETRATLIARSEADAEA